MTTVDWKNKAIEKVASESALMFATPCPFSHARLNVRCLHSTAVGFGVKFVEINLSPFDLVAGPNRNGSGQRGHSNQG